MDTVRFFAIHNTEFSGRFAKLEESLAKILNDHSYPEAAANLLGELVIVGSLLGSPLKFGGALEIILEANGLIDFATVDYFNDGTIRGYLKVKKDHSITEFTTFQELVGNGRLIITLDHGPYMKQYQGIVEIGHLTNLAECIEKCFLQSEQLPTYIRLSVATKYLKGDKKLKCGGGIIIHNSVSQSAVNNYEEWSEIKYLLDTLQHHELVD